MEMRSRKFILKRAGSLLQVHGNAFKKIYTEKGLNESAIYGEQNLKKKSKSLSHIGLM